MADGMVWECGPHTNAWKGHDARCRRVPATSNVVSADPEGYSIVLCHCEEGPYLGARKAGTPCCCERCGFMTRDQWEAVVAARVAAERDRVLAEQGAPDRLTEAEWRTREARRECSRFGHDWHVVQTMSDPVALVCQRPCGDPGYVVTRRPFSPES